MFLLENLKWPADNDKWETAETDLWSYKNDWEHEVKWTSSDKWWKELGEGNLLPEKM